MKVLSSRTSEIRTECECLRTTNCRNFVENNVFIRPGSHFECLSSGYSRGWNKANKAL